MYIVTTLNYDQLGELIKYKSVCLDNEKLIFGQDSDAIHKYFVERLGTDGYVIGIRGRINSTSVTLLSKLDYELSGDKVILEASVNEDEILRFNVTGIEEAIEILTYGLPQEALYEQLDSSQVSADSKCIQVICAPLIDKSRNVRIISLSRPIEIEADGVTVVKL